MKLEITMEEILEDLCWPGPPPGRWEVPAVAAAPDPSPTHLVDGLVRIGDDRVLTLRG